MKKNKIIIASSILFLALAVPFFINKKDNSFSNTNNVQQTEEQEDNNEILFEVTSSASYRTNNPKELYDIADLVLIAEYTNDKESYIEKNGVVFTNSEFKVKQVLKNENDYKVGQSIVARHTGGIISFQQFLENKDDAFKEKVGLNSFTEKQKASGKVLFKTESIGDKDLIEEKNRLLFLGYDETKECFVIIYDNLGMPSISENNKIFNAQTKSYTNYDFLK